MDLFAGLPERDLALLDSRLPIVRWPRGATMPEPLARPDHLYVVRVRNREELLPVLHERGVGAGVHYPVPLHLQPAYAYLGFARGSFPMAEKLSDEVISLPIYAEMDEKAPEYVASTLKELVGARA